MQVEWLCESSGPDGNRRRVHTTTQPVFVIWEVGVGGGGEGCSTKFYTVRLRPKVWTKPLPLYVMKKVQMY